MPQEAPAREPDAPRLPLGRRASVDLSGRVLGGRYRLLRRLGSGGMATIYEAEHALIRKRVAVKVLDPGHSDEQGVERFLHEALAASSLQSDHIIDVIDFGRGPDETGREWVYIAMECLDGEDLSATLEHDGPLRWTRVLAIGKQVSEALIAAHARGVVHCDIKPGNCFRITRGANTDFIKLLDFGVASFASKDTGQCAQPGERRRKSGPVIGTPGYMPEEQVRGGPYDHRVDIFALGVLMFRLLTNKMPYAGGSLYLPRRPASGPCPLRRAAPMLEIPDGFEAVILKSVASDPAERYQSAQELFDALSAVERVMLPPSRLPRDPLTWGEGSESSSSPGASSSAAMSATEVGVVRAGGSSTELSRSGVLRVEVTRSGAAWVRPALHAGVWMFAGFMVSVVATSAVRLFFS